MHNDFDLTKPPGQMAIGPNADGDMVRPEDWIGLKREIGPRECCHDPMKLGIELRTGFISLKLVKQEGDTITLQCLICGKEGTIQLPAIEWLDPGNLADVPMPWCEPCGSYHHSTARCISTGRYDDVGKRQELEDG